MLTGRPTDPAECNFKQRLAAELNNKFNNILIEIKATNFGKRDYLNCLYHGIKKNA